MSTPIAHRLRMFFYRLKYRHGIRLPLEVPVDVSLELSSHCNMHCVYCYHGDAARLPFQKGMMSLHTGLRILDEAAALGVNSLKFNWKGESTMNPHFEELTSRARELAHGSTFIERISNSNFKFPSNREEIFLGLANQTKVKVSLDSFEPKVFETQRAGGVHAVTMRNIGLFYDHPARRRSGTRIVIQAVRTKLNAGEDIAGMVGKLWPEAEVSIRDMVGGRTEKDLDGLEARRRDPAERQSCLQAHVRLIFNHAGVAFPCCPDIGEQLALGSIHERGMWAIFNGLAARKLRASLKRGDAFEASPCLGCSSFETFKGFKPAWGS